MPSEIRVLPQFLKSTNLKLYFGYQLVLNKDFANPAHCNNFKEGVQYLLWEAGGVLEARLWPRHLSSSALAQELEAKAEGKMVM